MIDRIKGTIVSKDQNIVIIHTNNIAFELNISYNTYIKLPDIGSVFELFTYLLWKEEGPQLFGFASEQERGLFKQLIKVEKVGPKLALAILSSVDTNSLINMVLTEDLYSLRLIKGVGDKLASRIILELKDAISKLDLFKQEISRNLDDNSKDSITSVSNNKISNKLKDISFTNEVDAREALQNLGYTNKEIDFMFSQLTNDNIDRNIDLSQLVKLALQKAQIKK